MARNSYLQQLLPIAVCLLVSGCGEAVAPNLTTSVLRTTPAILEPKAIDESSTVKPAEPAKLDKPKPADTSKIQPKTDPQPKSPQITLEPIKYDALRSRIHADRTAKLTMVDAWATWCPPCKENFPHVVAMHAQFAGKGLSVISLSLDDTSNAKDMADARAFLKEMKATFPNFVLDEEQEAAFEKLNIGGVPAVFLFGPDGKELKRFTLEDVDHPVNYAEVEAAVAAILDGKPIPAPEAKKESK